MKEEKNLLEIVKEYFPTIGDDEALDILWNCTGWPNFFPYGKTIEECIREQLNDGLERTN